jgi:putative transposase
VTRYRWVTARKAEGFPTTMACAAAGVSRQAFYDWLARHAAGPTPAEEAEARLVAEIREIHAELDDTYGSPRMTPELTNRGFVVNHKRVERLMRVHRIVGVFKPAKVQTTIPAEHKPSLPDLVGRRFAPGRPDGPLRRTGHRPAGRAVRARLGLRPTDAPGCSLDEPFLEIRALLSGISGRPA